MHFNINYKVHSLKKIVTSITSHRPIDRTNHINHCLSFYFQHGDGTVSSWKDVEGVYDLEKTKTLKKAPQLSAEHINPTPSARMRVKLAAQVFSRRVSRAMKSYVSDLSPTACSTAEFIDTVNNLFDFMNSSNLHEVGTRCPAMRQQWDRQQEVSTYY